LVTQQACIDDDGRLRRICWLDTAKVHVNEDNHVRNRAAMTAVEPPGSRLPTQVGTRGARRAFVGATIGNAAEWYDFAVYGFVAPYIGASFFPTGNSTTELLSSFAVFGLTFLVRPLGGLIFGPLGDRVGRKRVMVLVLVVMAVATTLVGLLPGYHTIGVAAPILLVVLRCLQALSAGGEYGSASTFMVEYAGPRRRARGSSWMMFSAVLGFMAGSGIAAGLAAAIGTGAMSAWGWRIPFLVAAPLGAIALYIRLKLEDTPEFRALHARGALSRTPLRETFKLPRTLAVTAGIGALHATAFYLVMSYMTTYIASVLRLGSALALASTLTAGAVALVTLPVVATVADRVGRRAVLLPAAAATAVCGYPIFLLISTRTAVAVIAGHALLAILLAAFVSTSVTTMAEVFPAKLRSSGVSVGYNLSAALFGGTAPFIATFLVDSTKNVRTPAWYLVCVAVIAVIAVAALREPEEGA
jgi:MHS family proline/betaine transporter-like MFS transporter